MNRPVHALVLGLSLSILATGAFAASLESKGSPTPNVATMPTYGMDVPTRMGLKSVLPADWQLFVHRTVALPETMNWNKGEAWPAVLTKFASDNQMAVLIDWDNHVVMLRSPEQALEEGATRQEIAQAATTPLPKFVEAKPRTEPTKAPLLAQSTPDVVSPAVQALPKFNVMTAPEKAPVVAKVSTLAVQPSPAATVSATAGGSAPVADNPVTMDGKTVMVAAKVLPAPTPASAEKSVSAPPPANPVAQPDSKLAALRQAQAAESTKLAAAQKAREDEATKLAATSQAREAESAKLAAAQQARESEAAKLASVTQAREAEVVKLAGVQKAAQDEAAKLAGLKKASEEQAATLAAAQAAAKAAVMPMPVIRVNPTPAMVVAQQNAAKTAPAANLVSTDEFTYSGPVALNRPTARKVAQAIADRFDMRLVYAAEEFTLPGPVTLLAESASQDAQLLERAVGRFGPVVLEVDAGQKVIRVVPRNASPQMLAEIRSRRPVIAAPVVRAPAVKAPVVIAAAAAVTPPVVAAPVVAPVIAPVVAPAAAAGVEPIPPSRIGAPMLARVQQATAEAPAMAKPAADTALTLDIAAKQPLEDAVARLARTQGYTVEWKVSGGFDANRSMSFTGRSLRDILVQVLPKLGLSADINTREKHIVVRPADAARDR
jgi:hypothetical protein